MVKLMLAVSVALTLSGCYYQRGYRAGYATGQYQFGWHDGYKQARGHGLEDKVRDLQMENAAIRAANKHLLELDGRK
jgi:phage-related protein